MERMDMAGLERWLRAHRRFGRPWQGEEEGFILSAMQNQWRVLTRRVIHSDLWVFFKFFNVYLFLREIEHEPGRGRERERERERDRIQSMLQALSCPHRARCGAQTHKLSKIMT